MFKPLSRQCLSHLFHYRASCGKWSIVYL